MKEFWDCFKMHCGRNPVLRLMIIYASITVSVRLELPFMGAAVILF